MMKTEFKEIATEVFSELLPKVKKHDRQEAIASLLSELEYAGLDIEDDEDLENVDDDDGDEA